jgi:hypothetical protein
MQTNDNTTESAPAVIVQATARIVGTVEEAQQLLTGVFGELRRSDSDTLLESLGQIAKVIDAAKLAAEAGQPEGAIRAILAEGFESIRADLEEIATARATAKAAALAEQERAERERRAAAERTEERRLAASKGLHRLDLIGVDLAILPELRPALETLRRQLGEVLEEAGA